jgi:hypothetical protein
VALRNGASDGRPYAATGIPAHFRAFPEAARFLSLALYASRRRVDQTWYLVDLSHYIADQRPSSAAGTEWNAPPESAASPRPYLTNSHFPTFARAAHFVHKDWRRLLCISAVLLLPCFWHRQIIASDLGSHLYNAWLAQLIQHGQAPGLYLSGQLTNVLFDWMLSGFGSVFGLLAAEKIVVSICVLVFFWGAFSFISVATGRAPWFLTPLIALFAYGWTFHIGLFNYYLAIGLSFFCLAIFWNGTRWERLALLPAAAIVAAAHPFGVMWLAGACVYIAAMRLLKLQYQLALLMLAAGAIWLARLYLMKHSITEMEPDPWYLFTGLDQLILFGKRYRIIKWAVLTFFGVALFVDVIRRRHEPVFWKSYLLPLQFYVVVELAVFWFPRGVHFPQHVAIALITERLTSISAIIGCCLLGATRPSKWHLAASLAIAVLFASFLYQDTAIANNIETQAERLVRTLPPNQRVLASIFQLDDSRVMIQHNIDLACIGYCFDYGNYEPGSAVFRVRATEGNPYVISNYETATDTEDGTYEVQPEDLPISQVYQCTESGLVLCIRPLKAGEANNRLGVFDN